MQITNTQTGPRGINTVAGPVLVDPNQTIEAIVHERERPHIEAAGWFKVKGEYASDPEGSKGTSTEDEKRDENGDTAEMAEMRKQFDAAFADQGKRVKQLEGELAKRDAMIAEMRKQPAGSAPSHNLEARHRGGGSYSITDATGNEIVEKLSKVDAEAFNAMSDEDKTKFVEGKKAS